MKNTSILSLLLIASLPLTMNAAQAADEDIFLEPIHSPSEQILGHGQSALWTMPLLATQYQPLQPTAAMQAALRAQHEGHYLDALILLDEAAKSGQASDNNKAEMNLLRASFLLQGYQSRQATEILAPLLANSRHAAQAYALTAMAYLQQGEMPRALDTAQRAHDLEGSLLPHLALSYALQGTGRLTEAREIMHGFNTPADAATPPSAIALAREAELALTLNQIESATALVSQAQDIEATHPYVLAVSGLTWLIDGQAVAARAAFESALQHDLKDAKALLGLGLAEIRLGNLDAGLKKLQAANEAEPNNALILTYLGRVQYQLGQIETALASWRSARQADPRDPTPWLYQAQAELQANRPLQARDSLREAQTRTAYRSVYRGEHLLNEDAQLLQANLAEVQHRLGLDALALHTLTEGVGEDSSATLRNQADALVGQRFGESARRSLLLQSLFSEQLGNLPAELDIYGDGAGQTGASTPQHGAISGLSAQQASYNNYDELFTRHTALTADVVTGSKNSHGEQFRLGVGSDTLGLSLAGLRFKTDGFAPFDNLDNRIGHATMQWRASQSTQAFVSHQIFDSQRGETLYPATLVLNIAGTDISRLTRLGLRHNLTDNSELRGLWSFQQTDQVIDYGGGFAALGNSNAHSAELQYRRTGAGYATQWGVQQTRGQLIFSTFGNDTTKNAQQAYAAWQQTLNPNWQLEAGLGWGKFESRDNVKVPNDSSTSLARWLPKLGVVYTPDTATHVRLAAWHGMDNYAAGNATLAPISLAGMLLTRPGDNDKWVRAVALGADRQLSPDWLLAANVQRRKTDTPVIAGSQLLFWQQVNESSLALHWQPQKKSWALSLAYDDERIQNDPATFMHDSVDEQHLRSQQVKLHWLPGAQWTANLAWSHNRVDGTQQSWAPPFPAYQDSFTQVDADLNWQFNRSGALSAGVRNASDTTFQYADIDRLNPRFSNGRLVYARLKLSW